MVCHVSLRSWISSKHFLWPPCAPSCIPTSFSTYKQRERTNFSIAALLRLGTGAGSLCYFFSVFLFIFIEGLWQPLVVVLTVTFNNTWVVAVVTSLSLHGYHLRPWVPGAGWMVTVWPCNSDRSASAVCCSTIFILIYSECHQQIFHVSNMMDKLLVLAEGLVPMEQAGMASVTDMSPLRHDEIHQWGSF